MVSRIGEKYQTVVSLMLILLAIFIPLFFAVWSIIAGSIPFWYDNARDLLSGWDNLSKPTLIGPTSGISGIFYGPYWIWLLSLGTAISKDPRISAILVGIIPYFLLFPLVLLYVFRSYAKSAVLAIWLLFMFGVGFAYAVNMWNPHIAPFLFLLFLAFFVKTGQMTKKQHVFFTISSGWTLGMLLNFHISFGIGVFLGVMLYSFLVVLQNLRNKTIKEKMNMYLSKLSLFAFGMLLAGVPFLLFEIKHGLYQTRTLLQTFYSYGSTIQIKGLSDSQIIEHFFGKFGQLFHISFGHAFFLEIGLAIYILVHIRKNTSYFTGWEKRLLLLLTTISIGILFVYLTARNPVWEYHFICVEIIFLLFSIILVHKNRFLRSLIVIWVIIVGGMFALQHTQRLSSNPLSFSSLVTKEFIVDIIAQDAHDNEYVVYAYNPSIYMYEYTYLFKWRYGKNILFDPNMIPMGSQKVYLILPKDTMSALQDFVHYRTPSGEYRTSASWKIPDGTQVLKRERRN